MAFLPAGSQDDDPERRARQRDARAVIAALQGVLAAPAYQHNVDLSVLTRIAADETYAVRERRRAAEVLLAFRLKALDALGHAVGVREQSLAELGLRPDGPAAATPVINILVGLPKVRQPREPEPPPLAVDALQVRPVDADLPPGDAPAADADPGALPPADAAPGGATPLP